MSKVYTSIDQLIGHTPLLELTHFEADEDLKLACSSNWNTSTPPDPLKTASPRT